MIYHPTPIDESTTASTPLPPGLAMMERASAALRAFCRAAGLDDYVVFHAYDLDLHDVDAFLPDLDPRAAWQPLPLLADAHQPHAFVTGCTPERLDPPGLLHLPRHRVVLARWHMIGSESSRETFQLAAAPSHEVYRALHRAVLDLRRRTSQPVWQIVHNSYRTDTRPRQALAWSELFMPSSVVARIDSELVGFFSKPVESLYESLNVPYRRGVLMYGPPGNGKTSIIRALGSALPRVPAFILRPAKGFDDDDLQSVFRKWTEHAPAILRLAGLLAVHDGSPRRTGEHLARATAMVHDTHRSARHGFPVVPEAPFGLAQFRRQE